CQLQRHPFADGKPSVKVLQSFGPIGTPGLENDYCAARAGIEKMLPKDKFKAIEALVGDGANADETREDLRALPLVSIDSPNTFDIDDALCAEPQDEGWLLTVAIADPTTCIKEAAELTTLIATRGTSHYFHGLAIPMLPEALSQSAALRPQEDKNALVCRLTISADGDITDSSIKLAIVQSKAKLSYQEVEEVLTDSAEHEFAERLHHLNDCFSALRAWRESRELVIEHRPEHRWLLNENKQIDRIEEVQKKGSQLLVEECMVAANRCIAQALKDAELPGPFVTHAGIRRDRAEEAKEFLTRFLPEQNAIDFSTLDGFRTLINELNAASDERPLRSMINRLMSRASFSVKPAPHMGMALPVYTNGTSPLRKALDFCVHLQLKAMLGDTNVKTAPATVFDLINQASAKNRQAVRAANNWLSCNFLNAQNAHGQSDYDAEIVHINTSGFTVKLKDLGLEGTVDLRREEEKFSFDKWEMALASKTRRYQLRQQIRVKYQPVEKPRGESASFTAI
ncbi:MAG: RNB domain-containing ribonuclease, partial [Halieaceae bacterium]